MSIRIAWLRLMFALVLLLHDAVRFLLLGTRSSAALKAENLLLRKQLALYLERKAKPRRADDATRLSKEWVRHYNQDRPSLPGRSRAARYSQLLH
jgi:hypothetical protein